MLVSLCDGIADTPLPRIPTTETNCLGRHSVPRGALGDNQGTVSVNGVPSTNLSHSIAPVPWGTFACRWLMKDSGVVQRFNFDCCESDGHSPGQSDTAHPFLQGVVL